MELGKWWKRKLTVATAHELRSTPFLGNITIMKQSEVKELQKQLVGKKTAMYFAGGIGVMVKIKAVESQYGHLRFLVSPISGSGEVWTQKINYEDLLTEGKKSKAKRNA